MMGLPISNRLKWVLDRSHAIQKLIIGLVDPCEIHGPPNKEIEMMESAKSAPLGHIDIATLILAERLISVGFSYVWTYRAFCPFCLPIPL